MIQWILDPTCLSSVRTPRAWAVMTPRGGSAQLRGCGAGAENLWTAESSPRARHAGMRGPLRRVRGQQRPHDELARQRLYPRRIRVTFCGCVQTASKCEADRIGARRAAPSSNFPLHTNPASQFFFTGLGRPHRLAKGSDLAARGFCVGRRSPARTPRPHQPRLPMARMGTPRPLLTAVLPASHRFGRRREVTEVTRLDLRPAAAWFRRVPAASRATLDMEHAGRDSHQLRACPGLSRALCGGTDRLIELLGHHEDDRRDCELTRGLCRVCASVLFWQPPWRSVAANHPGR